MTAWQFAMMCIVPFMWAPDKARTWMVLIAASLAAKMHWSPVWFMSIDVIAAAAVLMHPRGVAQKMIGLIFAAMAIFDVGFFLSPKYGDAQYVASLEFLGWLQWCVLLTWGVADGFRFVGSLLRSSFGLSPLVQRRF